MADSAHIADIRRLTVHDGPGIRDTVFVKGCPLRCLWCHNPESISSVPQILFHSNLCVKCGECVPVCKNQVHFLEDGKHELNRDKCTVCGRCMDVCLTGALTLCGSEMSSQQVFEKILHDRDFFSQSNGGVTVSGGEPLLYPAFTAALFQKCREAGIHTALDTCGAVPWDAFEKVLPFTDLVLFDVKGADPIQHEKNTGRRNGQILQNLNELGHGNIPIEIRIPVIPDHNDSDAEFETVGKILAAVPSVIAVRLLAYHSMAREKYRAAGMRDTMPQVDPPSMEHLLHLASILKHQVACPVITPEA